MLQFVYVAKRGEYGPAPLCVRADEHNNVGRPANASHLGFTLQVSRLVESQASGGIGPVLAVSAEVVKNGLFP